MRRMVEIILSFVWFDNRISFQLLVRRHVNVNQSIPISMKERHSCVCDSLVWSSWADRTRPIELLDRRVPLWPQLISVVLDPRVNELL